MDFLTLPLEMRTVIRILLKNPCDRINLHRTCRQLAKEDPGHLVYTEGWAGLAGTHCNGHRFAHYILRNNLYLKFRPENIIRLESTSTDAFASSGMIVLEREVALDDSWMRFDRVTISLPTIYWWKTLLCSLFGVRHRLAPVEVTWRCQKQCKTYFYRTSFTLSIDSYLYQSLEELEQSMDDFCSKDPDNF
jgi:hypothetical protein